MAKVYKKTNPKLFDKAVSGIQDALASGLPWLDRVYGICESVVDMKNGKKFISANQYIGKGHYEQVMPCEELGNFAFFTLKDPQETISADRNRIRSPFSLIFWYDMRKVSLPTDERNTEEIKDQILGLLDELHNPNLTITRIYEKWQNVFADFSYDTIKNQYLMSPYAGLRIEGYIETRVSCQIK